MQSNPAMCLTALALLLAPAVASGAEPLAGRSIGQAMMPPAGSSSSGLSALKSSNAGSSLRGPGGEVSSVGSAAKALARPSGHAWSDGLEALAAAQPSALMAPKGAANAMMPPHGVASDINGVEAIRRAAPSSESGATVESLRLNPAANLYQLSPR